MVECWDNNPQKWGKQFEGIKVVKPHSNIDNIEKIIIASSFYTEIYEQLTDELMVKPSMLERHSDLDKRELLKYYRCI